MKKKSFTYDNVSKNKCMLWKLIIYKGPIQQVVQVHRRTGGERQLLVRGFADRVHDFEPDVVESVGAHEVHGALFPRRPAQVLLQFHGGRRRRLTQLHLREGRCKATLKIMYKLDLTRE
jgi:hypothetical protein